MNHFILLVVTMLCCTLIGVAQDSKVDYYPPSPIPDRIMLTLTATPHHSMAINWRTSLGIGESYVQVLPSSAAPITADSAQVFTASSSVLLSDKNGARYHSAVMSDLAPDTKYLYRVGDSTYWSEWFEFKTASDMAKPVSFLYLGDAQNDLKSQWSRAIRGAYSKMPKADFIIHAGDLIDHANSDHEWGEWFYAAGWMYGMMPSVATPGNHEYYRDEQRKSFLSKHWEPTFTFPNNGPEDSKETVYYIDYQDVRVISINSISLQNSPQDSAAQVNWLINLLENNNKKWTVVTMHYPIYSSKMGRDNIRLRTALQPIFEQYNVDLVLQGHDHTYGRGSNLPLGEGKTTIGGPIYVVSVSGPKMYDLGLEDWVQRAAANTQLYQLIHIDGDLLKYEAYTITDDLYDAFELRKQPNGRNLFFDLAPKEVQEALEVPQSFQERYTEEDWAKYRQQFEALQSKEKLSAHSTILHSHQIYGVSN
ncbi:MAG: metallophosphoesterase family protein [Saprospiraceae bacterium]|nr:metallophosphoesterase family protein [Saprospiraceae bacterium]